MSEHVNDFVFHLKKVLDADNRLIDEVAHEPNDEQNWPNRDGKHVFDVSNREHWRTFRVTVEVV